MTPLIRAGIGFVIGVGLAFGGLWLGRADEQPLPDVSAFSPTTTTLPVVEPEWVPGGVRYESTVIVPLTLYLIDGVAIFDYELVDLAASSPDPFGPGLPAVLPETWQLELEDGTTFDAAVDPPPLPDSGGLEEPTALRASVRFSDLPQSVRFEDVADIRVNGWRLAAPIHEDHEISPAIGTTFRTYDGRTVTLDTIIEQTTGSILDFDVDAPPDPWHTGERSPFGRSNTFDGVGPGWISASSTIGGTGRGGSTGFQLRWSELEVPDSITVRYSAVVWTPLADEVSVFAEVRGG